MNQVNVLRLPAIMSANAVQDLKINVINANLDSLLMSMEYAPHWQAPFVFYLLEFQINARLVKTSIFTQIIMLHANLSLVFKPACYPMELEIHACNAKEALPLTKKAIASLNRKFLTTIA